MAAAAFFIGRSWDYVNDPIIGHLSDRTRSRWGRRRPFLLFGALPFGLAFAMLWLRPGFQTDLLLAVYYAAAFILFDTAATLVYMPYFALTPELTSEYDQRTSLTTYRMFFSILGSLVAFTIPWLLVGTFRPENAGKVLTMGFVFGLVSAAPLFLTFFSTRERQEFMAQEQPKLFESLLAAFKNPPFLLGMGIFLGTWISVDIAQAILPYFIKYCVLRETQSFLIMGTIFVTAILALPLWNWAARRWNKRLAYIAGIAFWAFVQMIIITLGPSTPLGVLLTLCALAGIGVAAAHVLPWSILPDAIEWDEWMFYSIVTLAHKFAASFAIPLVLLLLDAFKYEANAPIQQPRAELAIRLVTGPIPAVLLCLGILCAVFYPLSRERYEQIVRELEARRSLKKAAGP